ncbi:hypothetical protein A3770_17p79210 [Chloropicon primus]|uniref:Uncharacterized protein n=1 Tax=Chloropicon primus TaxID=1764295 RepID=A0A5B8MXV7_9CHLO|nr:hypothetical protein A3770_17p79210 [Chloropicon primus]|eukprot:QDZ25403.1 hypothetical protein A3770_17p79210 [Chloropicon primus]
MEADRVPLHPFSLLALPTKAPPSPHHRSRSLPPLVLLSLHLHVLQWVNLMFSSGLEARICLALGTTRLVLWQLKEATLMFCSGLEDRIRLALGTTRLVIGQLNWVTSMSCSGFEARTRLALGTQTVA